MCKHLTDKELEQIQSRCDAATPSPWISYIEGRDHTRVGKRLFACPPIMPIQRGQTIKPFAHRTRLTLASETGKEVLVP